MWLSCSLLALFLEESARLQTEATRLSTPMFMERDEADRLGYPDSDYPGGRSSYGPQ